MASICDAEKGEDWERSVTCGSGKGQGESALEGRQLEGNNREGRDQVGTGGRDGEATKRSIGEAPLPHAAAARPSLHDLPGAGGTRLRSHAGAREWHHLHPVSAMSGVGCGGYCLMAFPLMLPEGGDGQLGLAQT